MKEKIDLMAKMRGRWLDYYHSIGNSALSYACEHLGQNVPCPVQGGTDGFRLFKDANDTGGGVKQAEAIFKTGYSLLIWLEDKDKYEVAKDLFKYLEGLDVSHSVSQRQRTPSQKPIDADSIVKWVGSTWERAKPIAAKHYTAVNYFDSRGIKQAALGSDQLRFAFLNYWYKPKNKDRVNLGKFPSIVARVTNNDNQLVGVHRTYLNADGKPAKANLVYDGIELKSKKLSSSIPDLSAGRMIRLFDLPDTQVLHTAEGIETALSALQVFREPTYSLVNATNFASFIPSKSVRTIHNWVDKDKPKLVRGKWVKTGEDTAVKFKKRMEELGVTVINHFPPMPIPENKKGIDWNDVLVANPSAFYIA